MVGLHSDCHGGGLLFYLDSFEGFITGMTTEDTELERERMRLAACGIAAMQNTPESIKQRIGRDSPYWSASYGDVCALVDREIELRTRLEIAINESKVCALCNKHEAMHCTECFNPQSVKEGMERAAKEVEKHEERWGCSGFAAVIRKVIGEIDDK